MCAQHVSFVIKEKRERRYSFELYFGPANLPGFRVSKNYAAAPPYTCSVPRREGCCLLKGSKKTEPVLCFLGSEAHIIGNCGPRVKWRPWQVSQRRGHSRSEAVVGRQSLAC